MDDPWANAWGETSKPVLPEPSPGWSAPSVSALHGDREDDLSAPSWPKESSSHWGVDEVADTSIWGGTDASSSASAWNPKPSTFDKISLGGDSYPDLGATTFPPSSIPEESAVQPDRLPTPSPPSPVEEPESEPETPQSSVYKSPTPPPPVPPPISIPLLDDADGFGSFATASTEEGGNAWTPSKPSFQIASADAAAWGGGWEDPSSAKSHQTQEPEEEDEWEVARRQKEIQDRHVPPELLASILAKVDEMSNALWGDDHAKEDSESGSSRHVDFESLDLQTATQRLVPEDLVLPMNVPFAKTFMSKQLSEALKLTRHSHIARSSPIAMYMASKGSTSWEASIKARAALAPDDVTPLGWKIVEQASVEASIDDGKKKSGSGFFSFFGRKATNPAVESIKRPGSPASVTGVSPVKSGTSPRPSIDSTRSSNAPSVNAPGRSTTSSPVIITPEPTPITVHTIDVKPVPSIPSPLSTTSTSNDILPPEAAPPSAVSRFLGRFSGRSRRSASGDSLALSTDDLEFLSDVPTASPSNGTVGGEGADLDALSLMLKAPPPPTVTALPQPLPPPPKPAQLPRLPPPPTISPPPAAPTPPLRPVSTLAPSKPTPPVAMSLNDDFMDFLDAPTSKPPPNPIPVPQPNDPFSFFDDPFSKPRTSTSSSTSEVNSALTPPKPDMHPVMKDDEDHWASFDIPAPKPTKPIPRPIAKPSPPPPPQAIQPKRSFVPIMNSSRATTPVNSKPATPFSLPPPPSIGPPRPSSTMGTPLTGSSIAIAPLAPPPPVSRPPSVPPPNRGTHSLNDAFSLIPTPTVAPAEEDDDFDDFMSSPTAGPSEAPVSFAFGDFGPSTPAPPPAPPSGASKPAPAPSVPYKSSTEGLNFSFLGPPPTSSTAKSSTSLTTSGRKMSLPSSSSTSPSHTPTHSQKPSLSSMSTSSSKGHVRKVSREADHARTQSLLDSAAARGRWLAPPSPIPEALSPPPDSGIVSGKATGSLLEVGERGSGGGSKMQAQQAEAVKTMTKGHGGSMLQPPSWNFPPSPGSFSTSVSANRSASPPPSLLPSTTLKSAPAKSSSLSLQPAPLINMDALLAPASASQQNGSKSGGLSAQDLSFFEGL